MKTLYDQISRYKDSNFPALYYQRKTITYKKLINSINKMMAFFVDNGISKNDVVTILLPNIPSTIYCIYALNAIGATLNIIHPLAPLNYVIEACCDKIAASKVYKKDKYYDGSAYDFLSNGRDKK